MKQINRLILTMTFVCSTFGLVSVLYAQQLAFSGAEGYGKYAVGGRGGRVYEVTTLNPNGAGSLGAAIEASGPRTVVFRVAGTIEGEFNIRNDNITIAGQTAPGDGICIKGDLGVSADNVIIRYIRVRQNTAVNSESDAIGGRGHRDIILDHVSASWSGDEVMSFYGNSNVTIQWCMITEACAKFVDGENTGHRFGGIWGNNYGTYHHNLLAHNDSRNPRWASGCKFNDYRNNVLYNWGYQSSYGGEAYGDDTWSFSTINVIGNYCKPGPATGSGVRDRIVEPSARGAGDEGGWYVADNAVEGSRTVTANNWQGVDGGEFIQLNAPWDAMPINEQSPEDAYQAVLDHVGCSLPHRDSVDARIIEEVRNGTATYGDNGIITNPNDVGGWPMLQSETAPVDSDHDGMPDDWETAHGLNSNNASDRSGDFDDDSFTNLEDYLNEVGAFKAVRDLVWDGEMNNRYARIENWDNTIQPSRLDNADISNATVVVDAIGQHAGTLRLTDNAILNITDGWLDVADTIEIGTGCTVAAHGASSLRVINDIVNNGTLRLTGSAELAVAGRITNNGVLDAMTWSGALPAIVNNGIVLDSSAVKVGSAKVDGPNFVVTIQGYTGHNYRLQYRDDPAGGDWRDVAAAVPGADAPIAFTHANGAAGEQRFYRVAVD